MAATVGVVACTGVATAALIIRRDSPSRPRDRPGHSRLSSSPSDDGTRHRDGSTTTVFGLPAYDDHAVVGVGRTVQRPL